MHLLRVVIFSVVTNRLTFVNHSVTLTKNSVTSRMVTRSHGYCLSCSRTPEQCPSVVSLLAESYNPHVRYGAAMALGIACAGTGLKVSSIFRICMSARVKICQLTQRSCVIDFSDHFRQR